ncbi:hypothetical protein FOZ60_001255 [Perkinsus olseni]|uniref:Uncharacterized protein n=1 Tax=Perkinsus olseni TaxID=32597 RepID=A0A7J6P0Y5_PEROL|nr:hypothetical protein FOZ60_001255 [Perkinsus olseni]
MAQDMRTCERKIAKCNSGPRRRPDLDACKDATDFCDSATYDLLEEKGTSLYDVRASTDKEDQYFKVKPGPINEFLNKINVQTALGVSKEFVSSNREVLDAFDKFTTYDTTRFVVDLLDGGIKVALRDQGGIWRIGEPSIASCYDGAELAACTENELARQALPLS